jgi:glycosyltransferase involved in cell wall biosynthesis
MVTQRHCMVVHSYYPVGETRVQRQALALIEAGVEVDVLCLKQDGEARTEIIEGVRVTRLPVKRHKGRGIGAQLLEYLLFFTIAAAHLLGRVMTRRYDTVQVHNLPDFLVFAAWPAKLAGAKVILDLHDLMPELFAGRLDREVEDPLVRVIALQERLSCRFADHVITVTDDWEKTLHQRSCRLDQTSVVMNLADPRIFLPAERAREEDVTTIEIIYHGTFTERYGVDLLVRAFAAAAASNPRLRLTLLGDGEARPTIERLISELGIAQLVTVSESMIGAEELPVHLAKAHIGIVPNRKNIFTDGILPTKLLEYVAVRIPAIVSRTSAVEEYFDDSMVRFVEPGSTEALADAITELAGDADLRLSLSRAAAAFETKHHWSRQSSEYVSTVRALSVDGVAMAAHQPN